MSNHDNFFTRPIFQNRQMVQRSGHTITLSGETIINTLGTLQISAQILDFTGSTSASTIYNIAGVSGYVNYGQPSSFIVKPPIILSAGTSATTTVNVTGYILGGLDSEGRVAWFPASNFFTGGTGSSGGTTIITQFTGNTSADCITHLWITNLHGCSPITVWDNFRSVNSIIDNSDYLNVFGKNNTGTTSTYSFIAGGEEINMTGGNYSFTAGGWKNTMLSGIRGSSIVGGILNKIDRAQQSSILGGSVNNIIQTTTLPEVSSVLLGGDSNTLSSNRRSSIVGGRNSTIENSESSSIIASNRTKIDTASNAVIIGGVDNLLISGSTTIERSVIIGGQNITGTTNDTVYVPNLEVRGNLDMCVGGGTAFLPIISGCSPVTLQGHLVVNNQNTFGPIRPNYISELITSGMTTGGTYTIPIPAGWVVEDVIIYTKIQDSLIDTVAIQTEGQVWFSGNAGGYPLYTVVSSITQFGPINMKSVLGISKNGYFNNYYYFNTSDTLIVYFKDGTVITDITDGEFKVLIKYWDGSEL